MEIVLAFLIGYAVGAKAGGQGFDEVVLSAKAVRDSEEFHGLVDALRSHGSAVLRNAADILSGDSESLSADGVVERVQRMMGEVTHRVR
ncbi:MAG: hypothetical protein ACR2KC_01580 [Acidimicrobiales bacterium]